MAEDTGIGDIGELSGDLAVIGDDTPAESSDSDSESEPEPKVDESDDDSDDQEQEGDEDEAKDESDDEEEKDEEEKDEEEQEKAEKSEKTGERPRFSEMREKYPQIFKDFPELRQIMIREERFSQVFPNVEAARMAEEKSIYFDQFESALVAGDPAPLLKSLAENNASSFVDVVQNLLPTIFSINKEAFYNITEPVVIRALNASLNHGVTNGDKNLVLAARHLSNFLFGTDKVPEIPQKKGPDPNQLQLQRERDQFFRERFNIVDTDVQTTVQTELRQAVTKMVGKESALSPYEKKALVNDIISTLDSELARDERHSKLMRTVWQQAKSAGFTRGTTEKIGKTFLERAMNQLPAVSKRLISEALGSRRTAKPAQDSARPPQKKGSAPAPQKTVHVNRVPPAKDIDWNKTSDMDIISGRATLKARR